MACVSMFVKLSDPDYQAQPVAERLQSIVFAFFRVFDSNGDGIIELFEVNEILSDFVSGIAAIVSSLVDHFPAVPSQGVAFLSQLSGTSLI